LSFFLLATFFSGYLFAPQVKGIELGVELHQACQQQIEEYTTQHLPLINDQLNAPDYQPFEDQKLCAIQGDLRTLDWST
jgi:hypothetical protein